MPKLYLIDENKNRVEVEEESDFYRTVATQFQSQLTEDIYYIEFVTQAQYNQLEADEELVANTLYFITDDTTADDMEEAINNIINGNITVAEATHATSATNATNADNATNTSFTNISWSTVTLSDSDYVTTDLERGATYEMGLLLGNGTYRCIGIVTLNQQISSNHWYVFVFNSNVSGSALNYNLDLEYSNSVVSVALFESASGGSTSYESGTLYYRKIQ